MQELIDSIMVKDMRRLIFFLLFSVVAIPALASGMTKEDSLAMIKPKYWKTGAAVNIGFSQLSLTNWAAGGYGQISLNTFADVVANYAKEKIIWNNELQLGYGFIQSFETGYKKNDDRLILDSKFGYKAAEKLYLSAVYNLRTQFAAGYTDDVEVSNFFAPANMSLGLGIDYNPFKNFSINVAPLTGKTVMVSIPELRTKYGNAEDQYCRFELGAQVKIDASMSVSNFNFSTMLMLFSDYLNKPQNIKVNWDANVEAKVTKWFSVTLRTNLIYDDNVKIQKKDKQGVAYEAPGVQFKELFTVGLTYAIGAKK